MKVDIFFPMYIGDYLADTTHLTTRQHGAYHLLMYYYWRTRKPLPTDVERLLNVCSLSVDEWEVDGPVILEFFERKKEGYFHKRIEQELQKALRNREQKSLAGKHSAENRKKKNTSTDVQTSVATDVETNVPTKRQRTNQRNGNTSPSPSPNDLRSSKNEELSRPAEKRPKNASLDEWLETLGKDPTYAHVDLPTELGKMRYWLALPQNKGRQLTKRFILNWINKIEKPLGGSHVATTGRNYFQPKTFKEIDADNEARNHRNYLIASGLLPPDGSLVDAGLPSLPDPREKNA